MSTRAIEEALALVDEEHPNYPGGDVVQRARAELAALREAVRFIQTVDTNDPVTYSVASKAAEVNDLFDAIAKEAK